MKFGLSLDSHLSHHELVIADLFNLVVNAIRIDPEVRFSILSTDQENLINIFRLFLITNCTLFFHF